MGGGNYLGWSRYSGWSVFSKSVDWFKGDDAVEFFEAPKKIVAGKVVKPAPLPGRQEPTGEPKAAFPTWTNKGYLQKCGYNIDWPYDYRKEETAARDVAKLAAMGITAEVVPARGYRNAYRVKLISQPATPEQTPEPPAPPVVQFDVLSVP